jgi:hypothetical protein
VAPPIRPPAPVDAPYVDLRATSPDSEAETSAPDIDLTDASAPDIDLTEPSAPDIDLTDAGPRAEAHQVQVVETGAFARAECLGCDWTGPARRSRSVALADLERHP